MKYYDRFLDQLFKIALYVLTVYGCIMLVFSWVYVSARYIFGNSLVWGEEFLKISLAWFGLMSASVLSYNREHIGIVIFREKLFSEKIQNLCKLASQIIITIVPIILMFAGGSLLSKTVGQLTPALRIPIGIQYASIPVCFFIIFLYDVRNLVWDISAFRKGAELGIISDNSQGTGGENK